MSTPRIDELFSRAVPEIRLRDLPGLADVLAVRIRESSFYPEEIAHVETGARILAHLLAERLGLRTTPLWVQRGGNGLKRRLAPLVPRLPVGLRDGLRRVEEWTGVHRFTTRRIRLGEEAAARLRGRRVLLVDDASDTGRTLATARALLESKGVRASDLRTAVIGATTPRGRLGVDFFLTEKNSRLPWSADSAERAEAEAWAKRLLPSDETGAL